MGHVVLSNIYVAGGNAMKLAKAGSVFCNACVCVLRLDKHGNIVSRIQMYVLCIVFYRMQRK